MKPFEMRLEMIKVAMNYLEKRYEHEEKIFNLAYEKMNHKSGDNYPKTPKRITIGEVLKLASRFNRFVLMNDITTDQN